jgi:hypothetical protein
LDEVDRLVLKKIEEDYDKYGKLVMSKGKIAVQEHHIIPWNSKYTEDYIEYTKKF